MKNASTQKDYPPSSAGVRSIDIELVAATTLFRRAVVLLVMLLFQSSVMAQLYTKQGQSTVTTDVPIAPPTTSAPIVPQSSPRVSTGVIRGVELAPVDGKTNLFSQDAQNTSNTSSIAKQNIQAEEAPSDFQILIQSSTGKLLPIYGRELFAGAPSTFAPVDRIPVTADYTIGPGDEIVIRAWGQIDVDFRTVVDRNGDIFVPKVGTINLAGLKYQQLNAYLKTAIGRVFQNFDLTTSLGQLRSIQIYMVGHANRPGTYTVSSMSTLVSALFSAGGPSPTGSMRSIHLKREGQLIAEFDLYSLIAKGDMSGDVRLLPGDVIYIPPVGPQAAVAGSVNRPAVFELRGATSLQQLLELAGGVSVAGSADKVTVERILDRKTRVIEELDWRGMDFAMPAMNGDLFNVWPISPKFERTVTLRGNVQRTSRHPWRDGMRLSDLIPDKGVLISPDYWAKQNEQTIKSRQRVARSIDPDDMPNNPLALGEMADSVRGNQLDLVEPSSTRKSVNTTAIKDKAGQIVLPDAKTYTRTEVSRMLEEINWDYALIERLDVTTQAPRLISFNLGKLVLDKDQTADLALLPGDAVIIFSKSDVQVPVSRQTKYVTLSGEFRQAGVHQALPGETLRQLVRRIGGMTADAYPYAAEFTRESNRVTQARQLDAMLDRMERDLERSISARLQSAIDPTAVAAQRADIDGSRATLARMRNIKPTGRIPLELTPASTEDQLPDLVLEDGDRLHIPPRPPVLSVMGAVYNENSFFYKSGKGFSDYLAQAGGTTRDADDSRMYVLRADGTVAPANTSWFGLSASHKLNPGDTIVVPEKQDRSSWQKSLRDWTQILYQFGIGAAALRALRN